MRRAMLALTLVAVTVLGFIVFSVGSAEAWKCEVHPERVPNCTPPVTLNSTTSFPPVSVTQPNPSTSLPTTTTSSIPAPTTTTTTTSTPPPTPIPPRFAG